MLGGGAYADLQVVGSEEVTQVALDDPLHERCPVNSVDAETVRNPLACCD